jgi:hypothetical protein
MSRQIQFAACFLLGGAIALTAALARDPESAVTKDAREPATTGKAGARLDKSTLPAAFENLQLSHDQQKQVRQLVDKYNEEIDSVWKEFTRHYLDTIALEAKMLAAVEDTLDDSQRTHIRKHRGRTAHGSAADDRKERTDNRQGRREVRSDERDSEPRAAVEEVLIVGVTLKPEQERVADGIYATYFERLRNGKREIHELHNRILSLESEKLADIEQLLTKEQLTQLRQERQAAAAGAERSASESKPGKVK